MYFWLYFVTLKEKTHWLLFLQRCCFNNDLPRTHDTEVRQLFFFPSRAIWISGVKYNLHEKIDYIRWDSFTQEVQFNGFPVFQMLSSGSHSQVQVTRNSHFSTSVSTINRCHWWCWHACRQRLGTPGWSWCPKRDFYHGQVMFWLHIAAISVQKIEKIHLLSVQCTERESKERFLRGCLPRANALVWGKKMYTGRE